jgi:NAD(P)-dependent dehydrogenase (short-subunit alcohol dehydrogenase family)
MYSDLKGKSAIVTGGAGGIGSATVRALAENGVSVAIWDRNVEGARALAEEIRKTGVAALGEDVDVCSVEAVLSATARAEHRLGGIDLLINVAGGNAGTPSLLIDDMPPSDWEQVIALNLSAPFNCIQACIEPMKRRGGGAVVTVASLASIRMSMNLGVSYTSAKAGLLGLTRHAAFDLAQHRIRVNAVLPGPVITDVMRQHASKSALIDTVPKQLPIGRWVEPRDIANGILFFASEASSACTGTHIVVDGGMHIGSPSGTEIYFEQRRRP